MTGVQTCALPILLGLLQAREQDPAAAPLRLEVLDRRRERALDHVVGEHHDGAPTPAEALREAERLRDPTRLVLVGVEEPVDPVVVLDRESGETFTADIGDDNPAAVYIPGRHAHGFEALTDVLFCYHVTQEYDPADPDEQGICWADPRVKHLWSTDSPLLSERDLAACS